MDFVRKIIIIIIIIILKQRAKVLAKREKLAHSEDKKCLGPPLCCKKVELIEELEQAVPDPVPVPLDPFLTNCSTSSTSTVGK